MNNKPKIFISSTIFDFRDLRSSIKYYLESLGYDVQLSEFNDFEKDLNLNSYNACLKSIENSDYFILFIGGRVGGWFDAKRRESITQKEYRWAYELVKKKQLKIVIFIREEIWTIREDRKKLLKIIEDKFITQYELKRPEISEIVNYKSKFINDAEFIFSFINEVARIKEMKNAINLNTDYPPSNWIHTFNNFADIVDVLKVEFSFKKSLELEALNTNIKLEILSNLSHLLSKSKGKIHEPSNVSAIFKKKYQLEEPEGSTMIERKFVNILLFSYVMIRGAGPHISTQFIDRGLESGKYLIFDTVENCYKKSPFFELLFKLKINIQKFKKAQDNFNFIDLIKKYSPKYNKAENINILNHELITLIYIIDRYGDILNLSKGLLKFLMGDPTALIKIKLNKKTPNI